MQNEDELSAEERELEQALKTLRPAGARIDPMAAVLAAGRRANRRYVRIWQSAAAASILAACGLWLARGAQEHRQAAVVRVPAVAPSFGPTAGALGVEQPTLLAYRQALSRSPQALEAMLDRQAVNGVGRDLPVVRVGVFTSWNDNLHTFLGEM